MRERPILFSGQMVKAILEGRKTQTRRAVREQPGLSGCIEVGAEGESPFMYSHLFGDGAGHDVQECRMACVCPYGGVGDWLWVKETHSIGPSPDVTLLPGEDFGALRWPHVTYAVDGAIERRDMRWEGVYGRKRPSIHMPRWASRITLEITKVRAQRLQDISEADAKAEAAEAAIVGGIRGASYREGFAQLWESINGAESWAANPWAWALTFKRVTP